MYSLYSKTYRSRPENLETIKNCKLLNWWFVHQWKSRFSSVFPKASKAGRKNKINQVGMAPWKNIFKNISIDTFKNMANKKRGQGAKILLLKKYVKVKNKSKIL